MSENDKTPTPPKIRDTPTGAKLLLDNAQTVVYLRPCKKITDWSFILIDDHPDTVSNDRLSTPGTT